MTIHDIDATGEEFNRRFREERAKETRLLEAAAGKTVREIVSPLDGGSDRTQVDIVFEDGSKLRLTSCTCCFGMDVSDEAE